MSIEFNNPTTRKGLVQIYEKEAGYNYGEVSGDNNLLKEFAADVNLALDDLFYIGFKASGMWQLDDSNHTLYPRLRAPIVSGQRDYTFLEDGSGNLIIDIHKVLIRPSTAGAFQEISPVDAQSQNVPRITDGASTAGIPTQYDKTGNGIILDFVPNYNSPDGIEIWVNREASYFVYTDLTKKAGIPGLLHRYLALKPALDKARRKTAKNYALLAKEVATFEGDESTGVIGKIGATFARRSRDVKPRFNVVQERTD